jgi:hypothetical protein
MSSAYEMARERFQEARTHGKKITASNVKLKRAYKRPAAGDGTRILIDRLWPRGVKKVNAAIDQWAKDIAPSTAFTEIRLRG